MRSLIAISLVVCALNFAIPGSVSAKAPVISISITGGKLSKPIEITDADIIRKINIWSGPGNFYGAGPNRIPNIRDGSIVWSQGVATDPPKDVPEFEMSFNGDFTPPTAMYIIRYRYDPVAKRGYVYLPGKGEKGYDVNVRSIYRGVEGNWFHSSEDFDGIIEPLVQMPK